MHENYDNSQHTEIGQRQLLSSDKDPAPQSILGIHIKNRAQFTRHAEQLIDHF